MRPKIHAPWPLMSVWAFLPEALLHVALAAKHWGRNARFHHCFVDEDAMMWLKRVLPFFLDFSPSRGIARHAQQPRSRSAYLLRMSKLRLISLKDRIQKSLGVIIARFCRSVCVAYGGVLGRAEAQSRIHGARTQRFKALAVRKSRAFGFILPWEMRLFWHLYLLGLWLRLLGLRNLLRS